MAKTPDPRVLTPKDVVYRVIEPGSWHPDPKGRGGFRIEPDAFEDPRQMKPETLSFFVKGAATPREALAILSARGSARRACGTGKCAPTPEQMYLADYRVAAVSGQVILDIVNSSNNQLSLKDQGGGRQIDQKGHLEIIHGHQFSNTWRMHAEILSEDETLGA
jgi:hypothetical protein